MGRLIVTWNAIMPQAGSTTLAITIATILSEKHKVLLINGTKDRQLENYMQEVNIKSSIQQLDIFQNLVGSQIQLLTTHFSDQLDVIGSGVSKWSYLEALKKQYAYIIIDLSNTYQKRVIDAADLLFPMVPFNRFILDEHKQQIRKLQELRTTCMAVAPMAFQKEALLAKFELNYYILPYDQEVYVQTHLYGNLYTALKEHNNTDYITSVKALLTEQTGECFSSASRFKSFWGKRAN